MLMVSAHNYLAGEFLYFFWVTQFNLNDRKREISSFSTSLFHHHHALEITRQIIFLQMCVPIPSGFRVAYVGKHNTRDSECNLSVRCTFAI